jgi:hypothetical protein
LLPGLGSSTPPSVIGFRGQASRTQYSWARGRAQSALWLVLDAGLVCFWLTGPASGDTTSRVIAAVITVGSLPHVWRLVHPAGTCLSGGGVRLRSWASRWRQVDRGQVQYVEISTGRASSSLLLTDGTHVPMPGLPVQAARALTFEGPMAARRLTTTSH